MQEAFERSDVKKPRLREEEPKKVKTPKEPKELKEGSETTAVAKRAKGSSVEDVDEDISSYLI